MLETEPSPLDRRPLGVCKHHLSTALRNTASSAIRKGLTASNNLHTGSGVPERSAQRVLAHTPTGRRWPNKRGMVLSLVFPVGE
ncbi:hypothetical protein CEXT_156551 [Caerostris extrusa]|uniref:Uncharacterized protein n=1 Tax=Caerostris extrusa TaxID=172846 RepID=A0AAV4TXS2_CAEEX|nr:hypothetical protein CEXT_156551 [Caerostris extrusa]